jgi:transcriptional regulator of arginine metabolism
MLKRYRQEQILKLVRSRQIHTQEELAEQLRHLGIHSTQVTLSRDIHELGLAKTAGGYREIGRPTAPESGAGAGAAPRNHEPRHLRRIANDVLRDVRQAQNILVLKTDPGNAQPLALALDQEDWPEIVGTIAGDDTIMVVTPSNNAAAAAREKLLDLTRQ